MTFQVDTNPNAEALNAALRKHVRAALAQRDHEIERLKGVCSRLRDTLSKYTRRYYGRTD